MIKVSFKVPVDDNTDITELAARKLRVKVNGRAEILKKSVDARDKRNLLYAYTVAIETDEISKAIKNGGEEFTLIRESIASLTEDVKYCGARPIVVGTGPCGLFAALTLVRTGAKPIILERGDKVEDRKKSVDTFNKSLKLDCESNILFGEGGAGTFSDGKLNTGVNSPFAKAVLTELYNFGAPEDILYLGRPHVGTDVLEAVVKNIREELQSKGAEFHFRTAVRDIIVENGAIRGVVTDKGAFYSDRVYLAIGHSARDTFEALNGKNVAMTSKIFSMGVRIEHLQETIDVAQYGRKRGNLPTADYKAAVPISGGNKLYTFCMCPGGTVVNAASEEGGICVNGMSNYARDGINANSALLVNVTERDYGEGIFAGVEFQRKYERLAYKLTKSFKAPCQTYGDFVKGKTGDFSEVLPTVPTGYENCDLNACLPQTVVEALKEGIPLIGRKIRGFDRDSAVLTGVETRSSSPIRILRDENCQSNIAGLYPLGEGAGYAGGITSAAADGIRGVILSLSR